MPPPTVSANARAERASVPQSPTSANARCAERPRARADHTQGDDKTRVHTRNRPEAESQGTDDAGDRAGNRTAQRRLEPAPGGQPRGMAHAQANDVGDRTHATVRAGVGTARR